MFHQAQTYFVGNRTEKKFPDIFMREEKQQVDDLLDKILISSFEAKPAQSQ